MSRMHKVTLPEILLLSALFLTACATQTKEEVIAAPVPVAAIAEPAVTAEPAPPPPAPVVEQSAPAPAVMAEAPAPKPVVKKATKAKKKPAPVKAVEPAPAPAPAPIVVPAPLANPEAPAVVKQEATPPAVMSESDQPVEKKSFLEKYWLWMIGIVIAIAVFLWMLMKKD